MTGRDMSSLVFMTGEALRDGSGREALVRLAEELVSYMASHQDLIERNRSQYAPGLIERQEAFLEGMRFVALIVQATLDQEGSENA